MKKEKRRGFLVIHSQSVGLCVCVHSMITSVDVPYYGVVRLLLLKSRPFLCVSGFNRVSVNVEVVDSDQESVKINSAHTSSLTSPNSFLTGWFIVGIIWSGFKRRSKGSYGTKGQKVTTLLVTIVGASEERE